MTKLYILMMGLVSFVPSPDGKEMWVLLPNAIGPQASSDKKIIHRHETILLYSGAQVANGAANGFDEFESLDALGRLELLPGTGANALAAWPLSYEDLSINILPDGITYKDDSWCPPKAEKPTAGSASAFCWVPRMSDIAPTHAEIHPDLLPPKPLKASSPVRVRLRLQGGELSTVHFSGGSFVDGSSAPVAPVFSFKPIDGTAIKHEQALADLVLATAYVAGDQVEFVAKKFGGGERKLILKGVEGKGGQKELLVFLFNVMDELHETHPDMSDRLMRHFELYYRLSRNTPASTNLTIPEKQDDKSKEAQIASLLPAGPAWLKPVLEKFGGIHRPICTMARFSTSP